MVTRLAYDMTQTSFLNGTSHAGNDSVT